MWGTTDLREDGIQAKAIVVLRSTDLLERNEDFLKLDDPIQGFDFIYNSLSGSPVFQKLLSAPKLKKDNAVALDYINLGDERYRGYKYVDALECYTKSILFCENGTSLLGISFANRSAVLFDRKYYKECMEDIERALSNNYPENLKSKLLNRKEVALKLLPNQKRLIYYKSVSEIVNKNLNIDCASNSIEIRKNEKYGRHIIATNDIKIGEVISSEQSYCHIIHDESKLWHCHECLELCFNLIPCERCVTAVYCSQKCLQRANESFHQYECDFVPTLQEYPEVSIKMALKSLKEMKNPDVQGQDDIYRSDRFKEINNLMMHENEINFLHFCVPLVSMCLGYYSLKKSPKFQADYDVDTIDKELKNLLYRSVLICSFNPFNIKEINHSFMDVDSKIVGTAMYALTSLFNHSCVANCVFVLHGTNMVIRAMANIKKGEQCTICYGVSFSTTDLKYRQLVFKKNYFFTCDCLACVNKWPTRKFLPLGMPVPREFQARARVQLNTLYYTYVQYEESEENEKYLVEMLKDGIKLMGKLERGQPNQNYLRLRNMIEEIYTYQGCKNVPF